MITGKKIISTMIILSLVISILGITIITGNVTATETSEYTYRDTILILDDSEFNTTNGVTSGNGTIGNPYIIENWYINVSEIEGDFFGIIIVDTDAYYTIRNCYINDTDENEPSHNSFGIYLDKANNGIIENCYINECVIGTLLEECNNVNFNNNIYNRCGGTESSPEIPPTGGLNTGIEMFYSENITIQNNIFQNCYEEGLLIDYDSKNITVTENDFINNVINIVVGDIDDSDYLIYHNNFYAVNGTAENVYDEAGSGLWDNGTEGNYWEDYEGVDADGNGIGDTPFDIYGVGENTDNYPLMEPYEWNIEIEENAFSSLMPLLIGLMSLFLFIIILKVIINMLKDLFKQKSNKK